MNFSPLAITLALVLTLCSCSATKEGSKNEFGPTYKQRMSAADRALFRDDHSQRSSFEKQLGNSKNNKEVKTNAFKTRDFNSGKTFYEGDDKFKTNAFNQAGKTSKIADKTFHGGDKQSSLGNDEYKTSQSRFDNQGNNISNKTSPLSDDRFRTNSNREGTKALENSKRPLIVPRGEEGYSEGDISKLLNKS